MERALSPHRSRRRGAQLRFGDSGSTNPVGQGGIAYLMENRYGVVMPRPPQVRSSPASSRPYRRPWRRVKRRRHLAPLRGYLHGPGSGGTLRGTPSRRARQWGIRLTVESMASPTALPARCNSPSTPRSRTLRGLGIALQVRSYEGRSMGPALEASNARTCLPRSGASPVAATASGSGSIPYRHRVDQALVSAANRTRQSVPWRPPARPP